MPKLGGAITGNTFIERLESILKWQLFTDHNTLKTLFERSALALCLSMPVIYGTFALVFFITFGFWLDLAVTYTHFFGVIGDLEVAFPTLFSINFAEIPNWLDALKTIPDFSTQPPEVLLKGSYECVLREGVDNILPMNLAPKPPNLGS